MRINIKHVVLLLLPLALVLAQATSAQGIDRSTPTPPKQQPPPFIEAVDLVSTLQEWWGLDDISGTRIGYHAGLPLSDNNTVGYGSGTFAKVANSAKFINTNNEFLSSPSLNELSMGPTPFSLSVWVRMNSKNDSQVFVSKSRQTVFGAQFEYEVGFDVVQQRFYAVVEPQENATRLYDNQLGVPQANQWYHLILKNNPATGNSALIINNTYNNVFPGTVSEAGAGLFLVGATNTQPAGYCDCYIDELAIWHKLLTGEEQAFLYNGGAGVGYSDIVAASPAPTPTPAPTNTPEVPAVPIQLPSGQQAVIQYAITTGDIIVAGVLIVVGALILFQIISNFSFYISRVGDD